MTVDFDRTASDYATHRKGFPDSMFQRLAQRGIGVAGHEVLDLGTGTGVVARGFAKNGCRVVGLDIAPSLLAEARKLDAQAGVQIDYVVGRAEAIPLLGARFDVISAGQCWHWFDREATLRAALAHLRPGGHLLIAAFDWLSYRHNVVELTEELIERHNPAQPKPHLRYGAGVCIYAPFVRDLSEGGLVDIETFSYDLTMTYSHAGWRGRIRASQGVGAMLSAEAVRAFDEEHAALLTQRFPEEPLQIPHRVWVAYGRKPGEAEPAA